jgi:hypothetical protein
MHKPAPGSRGYIRAIVTAQMLAFADASEPNNRIGLRHYRGICFALRSRSWKWFKISHDYPLTQQDRDALRN